MKKLLVPLPTSVDNIHYKSGSFAEIYKVMGKRFELVNVGPLKLEKNPFYGLLNRLKRYGLFPWRFASVHSWRTVKTYARQIQSFADKLEYDAIFSCDTLMVAEVRSNNPIFAYADFSFYNALNYYPFATDLFPASQREALAVDRRSFQNLTKAFLASDWACKETAAAYDLPEDKFVAVARGANLKSGFSNEEMKEIVEKRIANQNKNLLFVGVNWYRKGGAVAYKIVSGLRAQGMPVTLTVVGCRPPNYVYKDYVQVVPFLSRNNPQELAQLRQLFENASLFILPTQAEAMGIVFAEAASFALPSIAYATGGVSAAIENGKTGILFSFDTTVDEMIKKTKNLLEHADSYRSMSFSAFSKYEKELNWDTIAERIEQEINKHL